MFFPKELNQTLLGLPVGECGILVAPGATGKSQFVLNLLLASCGLTENHLINKNMKVLYVSLEDRLDDIKRRLYSYKIALGINKAELEETEQRQKLSAKRTLELRDKEKNKEQLKQAKQNYISKKYDEYEKTIKKAIEDFKSENKKITVSSISKYTGIDRRAVKKIL